MNTNYRIATAQDVDALVRFWNENTGWDEIDRTEWERRFYQTPFGASDVSIAVEEKTGAIQGQIVFIPTEIIVDGRAVAARRPYALVISKNLRSGLGYLSLMKIVARLYTCATDHFKILGVSLVHMMPDPGWVRAFKLMWDTQTTSFPLWSLALPLPASFKLPGECTLKSISPTDEQINPLWQKTSRLHGCSFPRNTHTLPWKMSNGHYKLFGLFRETELIGLSASLAKEKDRQWLVCDLLASDGEATLDLILKATCNAAQDFFTAGNTAIQKIAIMTTPFVQEAIERLGFSKENYRFPMVVQVLDKTLSKKQVAPERWYASAND